MAGSQAHNFHFETNYLQKQYGHTTQKQRVTHLPVELLPSLDSTKESSKSQCHPSSLLSSCCVLQTTPVDIL